MPGALGAAAGCRSCPGRPSGRGLPPGTAAFTLLELLIALAIMATAMAIAMGTFHSITRAWQRGAAMADNLNRGEFMMEQILAGLLGAHYSAMPARHLGFGF